MSSGTLDGLFATIIGADVSAWLAFEPGICSLRARMP